MPPQTKLKADPREQYAQPNSQNSRYRARHAALLPSMDASFSLVASISTGDRRSFMSSSLSDTSRRRSAIIKAGVVIKFYPEPDDGERGKIDLVPDLVKSSRGRGGRKGIDMGLPVAGGD